MGQPMKKEWPQYRSHKIVKALEITEVYEDHGRKAVRTENNNSWIFKDEMFSRYTPVAGDFLVEYEDGYRSFSPRKAFLDGYTKVSQVNTPEELQKLLDDDVDQTITVHGDGSVSRADGFNEPDRDLQADHGNPSRS